MDIIKMYVNEKLSIGQFCKKYNLKRKDVVNILRDNGFIIKQGYKYNTIIALNLNDYTQFVLPRFRIASDLCGRLENEFSVQ